MDKTPKYIKMSEAAEKIQEILKDKFDYCKQGYCIQHKCFIESDETNCPVCPVFIKKWRSLKQPLGKEERTKFGFNSSGDCEYNKKWIGLPYQDQLQKIHFDSLDKSGLSAGEARAAFILASI